MPNSKLSAMQSNTVYDCTIVHLDKHHHAKGNITVVENGITVPFDVRRAYYLYDVLAENPEAGTPTRNFRN